MRHTEITRTGLRWQSLEWQNLASLVVTVPSLSIALISGKSKTYQFHIQVLQLIPELEVTQISQMLNEEKILFKNLINLLNFLIMI